MSGPASSDLDLEIGRWRERQERTSMLSPRELDELEDHLRARVDLELEVNALLTPTEAFAIARREMGEPAALEKEFAKAGKPRWRQWLAAGWAMFAASFVLPVAGVEVVSDYVSFPRLSGFQVFLNYLESLSLVVLPNFAMLLTIPALVGRRIAGRRWLPRFLALSGVAALGLGIFMSLDQPLEFMGVRELFGVGYWTWAASLVCVATALRLRARERAPVNLNGPARTEALESNRV